MSSRVVLDGVDQYRINEPLFEGVRVILNYRGETYSPAYLQGVSGAAFRIGGPCPCAPTCEYAMSTDSLIELLGYRSRRLQVTPDGPDRDPSWQALLSAVKDELRAGRPLLLWHAFTSCEFDVVCGFDENDHKLYGRGSYAGQSEYAVADELRPLESTAWCGGPHALLIQEKINNFESRSAEISALREAVLHAHGASASLVGMPTGLACYDSWIASYQERGSLLRAASRSDETDLGWVKRQTPDDWYVLTILVSVRQAAAEFLREIEPKYPQASPHLLASADYFQDESEVLAGCLQIQADRSQALTEEQCLTLASILRKARASYALAIDEIARGLRKIEPVTWEIPRQP